MSSFLRTPDGYINVNQVKSVRHEKEGQVIVTVDDVLIRPGHLFRIEETIVSLTSVQGDWEFLILRQEEDGSYALYSEPVLAWGLTTIGELVPISASSIGAEAIFSQYAIRKKGEKEVYGNGGAFYEDEKVYFSQISDKT